MPNTLAHIGAQLPATQWIFRKADPRWAALGLLIPDLPWIFQRIIHIVAQDAPVIDVRAYVVVMSTPIFCLILSGAIALLFKGSRWVFFFLSINCIAHELLDAIQEKGGVGVPFFGPVHWQSYSWPVFPMDGWISTLLTVLGAITLIWVIVGKLKFPGIAFQENLTKARLWISTVLLMVYTIGPWFFMQAAIDGNVHDLKVWSGTIPRTGMQIHFDRANFHPGKEGLAGGITDNFNSEPIRIEGIESDVPVLISTIATFKNETTLVAGDYVVHPKGKRFWYTIAGLIGVGTLWIYPLIRVAKNTMGQKPLDSIL